MIGNKERMVLGVIQAHCHHSLVSPIDWKPDKSLRLGIRKNDSGHHSLVTPIDWKLETISAFDVQEST